MANIRNVAAPNFPVAPDEYDRGNQDQLVNVIRLFSNTVANAINAPKVHGSFYSTVTQQNPVANAVNKMTVNQTATASGVVIGSPTSRIYVSDTAVYNIQFSAQLDKAAGSSAQSVYIWVRINGIDLSNSASQVTIKDTSSEIVPSWNFLLPLKANDYFEIAWASPDTDMQWKATTASGAIPGIPSVIITVTWISNIPI